MGLQISYAYIRILYTAKRLQGKVLWFSQFSFSCESFPVNHSLLNWQYKCTIMLQQKFYHSQLFSTQNVKAFPCGCFSIYGMQQLTSSTKMSLWPQKLKNTFHQFLMAKSINKSYKGLRLPLFHWFAFTLAAC